MISRVLPQTSILIVLLLISFFTGYLFSNYTEQLQSSGPKDSDRIVDEITLAQTPEVVPEVVPEATVAPLVSKDLTVLWESVRLLEKNFYGYRPSVEEQINGAIHGLVARYGDKNTKFVEPAPNEIAGDTLRGRFGGIGAYLDSSEFGFFLRPIRDLMAEQVGIQHCDLLLAIDGTKLDLSSTVDEVSALIRGEIDTVVTLEIRRAMDSTEDYIGIQQCPSDPIRSRPTKDLTFAVTRADIEVPSMEWYILKSDATLELPANVKIGYIKHSVFSERSATEMHLALSEMLEDGADRFIWDLRGNPGGVVDIAIELADMWLVDGTVMREEKAYNQVWEPAAEPGGLGEGYPVTLLVDGGSASASEIIAGAFQDHGRALLIGTPTHGKGSVQLVYQLSNGGSLHVTNAEFFTPLGRKIDGQPLQPDMYTQPDMDPLQEAIKIAIKER